MSWKHNYNFLPDNTSFNIIDIVHLIEYNLFPHSKKARKIPQETRKYREWQKKWNDTTSSEKGKAKITVKNEGSLLPIQCHV